MWSSIALSSSACPYTPHCNSCHLNLPATNTRLPPSVSKEYVTTTYKKFFPVRRSTGLNSASPDLLFIFLDKEIVYSLTSQWLPPGAMLTNPVRQQVHRVFRTYFKHECNNRFWTFRTSQKNSTAYRTIHRKLVMIQKNRCGLVCIKRCDWARTIARKRGTQTAQKDSCCVMRETEIENSPAVREIWRQPARFYSHCCQHLVLKCE
jgi:hypothetical protein